MGVGRVRYAPNRDQVGLGTKRRFGRVSAPLLYDGTM